MKNKKKPLGLVISRSGQHYYIYEDPIEYVSHLEGLYLVDDYFEFNMDLDVTGRFLEKLGHSNYYAIIFNEKGWRYRGPNNSLATKICNHYIYKDQVDDLEVTGEMIIVFPKWEKTENSVKKMYKPLSEKRLRRLIEHAIK